MNVTLQLRPAAEAQREPTAVLLWGDDTKAWYDAICRWPVDQRALRLVTIPGNQPGELAGVLVLLGPAEDGGIPSANNRTTRIDTARIDTARIGTAAATTAGIRGLPAPGLLMGHVHRRLLIPIDAVLDPALTKGELESLMTGWDGVYVWLPSQGLIRCDATVRRLAELVAVPSSSEGGWDAALPGETLVPHLLGVVADFELSIAKLMESAGDDIGVQSGELDRLPRRPGEPFWSGILVWTRTKLLLVGLTVAALVIAAIAYLGWRFAGQVLPTLMRLLTLVFVFACLLAFAYLLRAAWRHDRRRMSRSPGPRPPGRQQAVGRGSRGRLVAAGGWWSGVRQWWSDWKKQLDEKLRALQHREVERLLHLLDSMPDVGLRYALPMGGDRDFRGLGAPTADLAEHDIDFRLRRPGAGGVGQFWTISAEYHRRLAAKYRELANREITLGRFRRAAYIFAELLGDWHAAAGALAQGGFHREAAVIYDERLKNPSLAASSLERAGLLQEAIPYFERLGDFERVGDLYERLEQQESAVAAFQKAVSIKLAAGDYLAAARLQELKLKTPEVAYETLSQGWPSSSQAKNCLRESFRLLAKMGHHTRAVDRIRELMDSPCNESSSAAMAECLVHLSVNYPDRNLQELAADRTRVLVSRWLEEIPSSSSENWLQYLRQLAPNDALLARDCHQYQRRTVARPVQRRSDDRVVVYGEFRLPEALWEHAIIWRREFYALGFRDRALRVARGLVSGSGMQVHERPRRSRATHIPARIAMTQEAEPRCLVHQFFCVEAEEESTFAATDFCSQCRVSGHPALTPETYAFQIAGNFLHTLNVSMDTEPRITIQIQSLWDARGQGSWDITPLYLHNVPLPVPFSVYLNGYLVGERETLAFFERNAKGDRLDKSDILTDSLIYRLDACIAPTPAVAVSFEKGGMIKFGPPSSVGIPFARDLPVPLVCFLRHGLLAVASTPVVQFYNVTGGVLRYLGEADGPDGPNNEPIAVCPLPMDRTVAVFYRSGLVRQYCVDWRK